MLDKSAKRQAFRLLKFPYVYAKIPGSTAIKSEICGKEYTCMVKAVEE